ncbi:hypothetical protein RHGRI_026083 [Rhododendron griersonianum]|uniref:Uncharacterized protein n=1 Tax=Rhododendron griersonianum TaxID=479676 RepID=A0AAV6IRI9_9ERIC|nr:hypothetical protein RHGRI_026083 [Rhododendron griersonianum]
MDLLGLLTQQYQGLTSYLDRFGGRLDAIDTKLETIDQYNSLFVKLFANLQEKVTTLSSNVQQLEDKFDLEFPPPAHDDDDMEQAGIDASDGDAF